MSVNEGKAGCFAVAVLLADIRGGQRACNARLCSFSEYTLSLTANTVATELFLYVVSVV